MVQLLKPAGVHGRAHGRIADPAARIAAPAVRIAAAAGLALIAAGTAMPQSIARPVATVRLHKPQIVSSPQFTAFAGVVARLSGADSVALEDCRAVLDTLIDQYLVEQEAVELRLIPTEAEIDAQMVARRRQVEEQAGVDRQMTEEEWRAVILRDTRLTLEEYRERFTAGLVTQRLVAQTRSDWMQALQEPSAEDLQRFYNVNVRQFVQPEMALILHIHFSTLGQDEAGVRQARERAEAALQELRDGASFEDLVSRYSDDSASRYRGGELGNRYLRRDDTAVLETLGEPFLQALFAIGVGEVSGVVESDVGFHILKMADRLDARLLTLDDPVTPRSAQTVRGQITTLLTAERQGRAYQQAVQDVAVELRGRAEIEVFEANLEETCSAEPS